MPGEVTLPAPVRAAPNTRIALVDVARGMAIVLVVLGHNRAISRSSPDLVATIFLFHVPLFFLLSGWVMSAARWSTVVRKLAARLLVPCFAAALAVGAIKSFTRQEPAAETLLGIAWATGQTLPWSHLWFLPTLFLALLATGAVERLTVDRAWRWVVAIVLAAALGVWSLPFGSHFPALPFFASPVGLPWSLDLLPLCLVFVWLGCVLRRWPALLEHALKPVAWVPAALLFIAIAGGTRVDMNMRVFTPFLPALMAAACGCILALRIAASASRSTKVAGLLALLGRHTLTIFILHVSIQKALLGLLDADQLGGLPLWLAGVLTSAVAVLVPVLVDHYVFARLPLLRSLSSARRPA